MNRQEVYNKVKTHLLTQNARAMDASETCLYRGPDGLKCAIGCLISDEAYNPDMEGETVLDSPVREALAKSGIEIVDEEDEMVLTDLQKVHDHEPITSWPRSLRITARTYNLTP